MRDPWGSGGFHRCSMFGVRCSMFPGSWKVRPGREVPSSVWNGISHRQRTKPEYAARQQRFSSPAIRSISLPSVRVRQKVWDTFMACSGCARCSAGVLASCSFRRRDAARTRSRDGCATRAARGYAFDPLFLSHPVARRRRFPTWSHVRRFRSAGGKSGVAATLCHRTTY